MEIADMDEKKLFAPIEAQLQAKFGAKGKQMVEDNLRILRRAFNEIRQITSRELNLHHSRELKHEIDLPVLLKLATPAHTPPLP